MTSTSQPRLRMLQQSPTHRLRQAIVSHVTGQFAHPSGIGGRVAGRIMATRGSNVDRNHWLVELVAAEPGHRVLEVGSGPGIAIERLQNTVPDVQVTALDHAALMLHQAAARNESLVRQGRLRLIERPAELIGPDLGRFDRIYAMNVWQFWADQETMVASLADRLEHDGTLTLGYQPRHPGADEADVDAAGRCMTDQFLDAGLIVEPPETIALRPVSAVAVTGRRR